jgi:hypothetical protein
MGLGAPQNTEVPCHVPITPGKEDGFDFAEENDGADSEAEASQAGEQMDAPPDVQRVHHEDHGSGDDADTDGETSPCVQCFDIVLANKEVPKFYLARSSVNIL